MHLGERKRLMLIVSDACSSFELSGGRTRADAAPPPAISECPACDDIKMKPGDTLVDYGSSHCPIGCGKMVCSTGQCCAQTAVEIVTDGVNYDV